MVACHDDLNQNPIDPDSFTEGDVFANVETAKGALAKLYASMALTGQEGPAGQPDIADIDEGFSQYSRMLFMLNELTTDHAVLGWGDSGVPDMHGQYWTASNDFTSAMYMRLAQQVSFCNSFITNAADLEGDEVASFIAEARFLRAFAYYNLIDMYANVPLVTEISTDLPSQSTRSEVYTFIENELIDIETILPSSQSNEYGRVDQVAAWALLSKLYLNGESWTGVGRYSDCITYSDKVINSSYSIHTNDLNGNGSAYDELFLADNDTNGAQREFIYTLNFDGVQSQTYGGTTFLTHAAVGGTMVPADYGIDSGWGGLRTTSALVGQFTAEEIDVDALNASLGGNLSNWGLVGDATENSWDGPDMEMYEVNSNQFSIYATLTDGFFKFRFDEDWGVNYGSDLSDGTLQSGGENIPITAGTYLVTMDLDNLTYTLTEIFAASDTRAMFYTDGQSLEIETIPPFKNGYAVTKFKNIDSQGNPGVGTGADNRVDTDLPLIRLPEIFLNYAEASLRGGGGDISLAVSKINELRTRAFGGTIAGNINVGDLDLEFVLNERSRELFWEGQRRTDLVRYNSFTTNAYLWPWKGNQRNGTAVGDYRNIFPIPSNTILTNPNLNQNPGY